MNFEPEEDDTIQYVCEPSSTKKVVESLGTIHASSTFASISYASGDGIHTARVKIEAHFNLVTKDRHGERCKGGDRVVVEIIQPDGTKLPSRIVDEGMFHFEERTDSILLQLLRFLVYETQRFEKIVR